MQAFDIKTVMRAVGPKSCSRGLSYAENGAVETVDATIEPDGTMVLTGEVAGTAAFPYQVRVYVEQDETDGRTPAYPVDVRVFGHCSCPVGINCKHVAAVMFAAGRLISPPPPRGPAAWDALLAPVGRDLGAPRAEEEPVALLIEQRESRYGRMGFTMRPVRMGKRGRWIKSGVSWRDINLVPRGFPRAAVRVLQEIVTLDSGGLYGYGYERDVIDLTRFPSRHVWDALANARAARLPIVSSVEGQPVSMTKDPAVASLQVRADGEDWAVRPAIMLGDQQIDADIIMLGDPAHGIAWYEGGEGGPRRGSAPRQLHLARLDRELDGDMLRMLAIREPIVVPAADHSRFLRDFVPGLRQHLEIVSPDASVEIADPQPGRLALTVTSGDDNTALLTWTWRYALGDDDIEVDLASDAHQQVRDAEAEAGVLADVVEVLAPIPGLVNRGFAGTKPASPVRLTAAHAMAFERRVLPTLDGLDHVEVDIAADALGFREAIEAPVVTVSAADDSAIGDRDWFDLQVTVTVDGEEVPFAQLFSALATGEEYLILPSGTYFGLDRAELRQLSDLIAESWTLAESHGDVVRVSRYEANFFAELEALGVLDAQARAWSESIRELATIDAIATPDPAPGFEATLRPYQELGYTWLSFLYDHRLGGVLADDMGLGKTLQALAMICRARATDPDGPPFLVVAPTSVVANWASEAARFAPDLTTVMITATHKRRGVPLAEACAGADLVVTSYALFRLEYDGYEEIGWAGLLLDEAQHIKNHQSKGYQCARALPVPFKLVISGTPMENNLMELWSMFSLTAPGLLGNPRQFTEHYRTPIERGGDDDRLARLRARIRPLLLRRTKQEVVTDLPPKTEALIELELSPKHRRVYQRYLQRERRKVLGLLGDLDRNRFEVFRSLTLLRQAALDVGLVDDAEQAVPSTKLDALMDTLAEITAEGHRVLVFSQFTRFLASARARLDAAGIDYCYLDGSTRNRPAVLDEFKTGAAPVFLISLKAGGVGLNLTEADYCIVLDPWWNPAAEQQAVDRAHRIGQQRPVVVYRMLAKDTIEEKVMALKARKAALFDSIMTGGGVGSAGLTAKDIRGLLA